jgi:hypothetical protein
VRAAGLTAEDVSNPQRYVALTTERSQAILHCARALKSQLGPEFAEWLPQDLYLLHTPEQDEVRCSRLPPATRCRASVPHDRPCTAIPHRHPAPPSRTAIPHRHPAPLYVTCRALAHIPLAGQQGARGAGVAPRLDP